MKINSITKLCILTLVYNRRLHGYEIIKEVEKKTGIKLSASHIYPFLKELKKNGFVVGKTDDGKDGGHEKNVYQMTEKGKKFYKSIMSKFSMMLDSGIKSNVTVCYHCKCEIYKNHYYQTIRGKRHAFCCSHCAEAYKNGHEHR